jgi:EAL domain-containing protein (putative c-di-GMP-specific phosphodiesterase class I)/CheY-like chemotaxis protein
MAVPESYRPWLWGSALAFATAAGGLFVDVMFGSVWGGPVAASFASGLLAGAVLVRVLCDRRRAGVRTQMTLALGEVASKQQDALERDERLATLRRTIRGCLDTEAFEVHFQPIVAVRDGSVIGVEALARFKDGAPPATWFAAAARAGLGVELELLAARVALREAAALPRDVYVALNVSPATAMTTELYDLVASAASPVLLELTELTEHGSFDDTALVQALRPLRQIGTRLAAGDTGSGYAGLQHLLQLAPDCIKLNQALIRRIDADPAKRALASAIADFARQIDAYVVADGVETEDELRVLRSVGVQYVQGFHLAEPAPLPEALPRFVELQASRVLIVDDDPIVRSVLRASLDKGGFEVVGEAANGAAAIALARTNPIDVVLLDLMMPVMRGDEAIFELRALHPNLAIILLTAAEAGDELTGQVEGFIDKTIAIGDVAELVQGILRNRVRPKQAPTH